MDETTQSLLLAYEKSTFHFDLINHPSGHLYLNIKQQIEGQSEYNELKINPSVLEDFIQTLQHLQKKLTIPKESLLSPKSQNRVVERYLKGVPIEDLPIQFNCSQQVIELILLNKGIPLVDNKYHKSKNRTRRRK